MKLTSKNITIMLLLLTGACYIFIMTYEPNIPEVNATIEPETYTLYKGEMVKIEHGFIIDEAMYLGFFGESEWKSTHKLAFWADDGYAGGWITINIDRDDVIYFSTGLCKVVSADGNKLVLREIEQ